MVAGQALVVVEVDEEPTKKREQLNFGKYGKYFVTPSLIIQLRLTWGG